MIFMAATAENLLFQINFRTVFQILKNRQIKFMGFDWDCIELYKSPKEEFYILSISWLPELSYHIHASLSFHGALVA